jgi:hypothetical protein
MGCDSAGGGSSSPGVDPRRFRLLVLCLALIAPSCGSNPTTLPNSDSSPPLVFLDTYNLPPQPSPSTTPANPESVDSNCCDRLYKVVPRTRQIAFIAKGEDPEGVSSVKIWFEVNKVCTDPNSDLGQSRHGTGIVAIYQSDASPSPGAEVPTTVYTAKADFSLAEADPGCTSIAPEESSLTADVYAVATNFYDLQTTTKIVTLSI